MSLQEIAQLAGVSKGTVSRALNDRGQLSRETRDRVLAAAEQLGFERPAKANAGRSNTVGLLTSDSLGRFGMPVLAGAEDFLSTGGTSIFLCDTRADPIRERHYIDSLIARDVDGLIVTAHRSDTRASIRHATSLPVVYAYSPSENDDDTSVITDDRQGGRIAGEHLIGLGRTRIAFIGGPRSYHAVHERLHGLRDSLAASGLTLVGQPVFGDWDESWGRTATSMLLSAGAEVDAVFCASDKLARGAVDALRDAGMRIPDDIAVVGFDNWDAMVAGARPQLTSVDPNLRLVGSLAARKLMAMIDGTEESGTTKVECELVIRGSTVGG